MWCGGEDECGVWVVADAVDECVEAFPQVVDESAQVCAQVVGDAGNAVGGARWWAACAVGGVGVDAMEDGEGG